MRSPWPPWAPTPPIPLPSPYALGVLPPLSPYPLMYYLVLLSVAASVQTLVPLCVCGVCGCGCLLVILCLVFKVIGG